jgi:ankyrin repeat protein
MQQGKTDPTETNAKAKDGATPLMYAEIFQRTEIAEILRNACAKK